MKLEIIRNEEGKKALQLRNKKEIVSVGEFVDPLERAYVRSEGLLFMADEFDVLYIGWIPLINKLNGGNEEFEMP